MSLSKLSKSGVMSGPLDSVCLPCEVHLKSAVEADRHVDSSQHQAQLDATHYVHKYQGDNIRKVKQGYYCEFCNKLFGTAMKVDIHVFASEHWNNKGLQQLKHEGDNVVAFDNLLLDENSWHGFVGSLCVLCNTDFEDKQAHKSEEAHILNLIQTTVEFDSHGVIYRKEGNDTFYCLICNALFPSHTLEMHFENAVHVKHFKERRESFTNQASPNIDEKKDLKDEEVKDVGNSKSESATEMKTANNISGDIKNTVHPLKAMENATRFAKENKLRFKWGRSHAYCSVCDITISSSLQRMKEHVAEATHKNKANALPKLLTKPLNDFIESLYCIETPFSFDVVINDMFCISAASFQTYTHTLSRMFCQVCEASFEISQLVEHCDSDAHQKAMTAVPVFHTVASEFIREARPGLYHCGFCNFIEGNWSAMENHLKSSNHKNKKGFAQAQLRKHRPDIHKHKQDLEVRAWLTMMMMMRSL